MCFPAPPMDVQHGRNHYSRFWPCLVLSSWWECLFKTRISYRQGLGPSQLPPRHIRSLYTPIRRVHSPCCTRAPSGHAAAAPPRSVIGYRIAEDRSGGHGTNLRLNTNMRGNRYLRRLLINGASANLLRSKATKADPWVIGLRRRRPPLVVAVALPNKTARIAWAVMLRQKEYQPGLWRLSSPRRQCWSLRESNDA